MASLYFQRRLAMSLLKCGHRKVWLDPNQKVTIAKARNREQVRDLIAQKIIQLRPGHRGRPSRIDNVLINNHRPIQRIFKNYEAKMEAQRFEKNLE